MYLQLNYLLSLILSIALVGLFYMRRFLLVSLISLEFVLLNLFIATLMVLSLYGQPISIGFYILILGACEASLGLSLTVMISRFKGSDMLRVIRSYKY